MQAVLETRNLNKAFGGLAVTREVNFRLGPGARHALIGPNGAGKTTFINQLTGVLSPTSGRVLLNGEDITGLPPHLRVKRGMARTFQINTLFPHMTPLEAVTLAICEREADTTRWFASMSNHARVVEEAYELLQRLDLTCVCNRPTRELAYGRQRLLEIALSLASSPKVLLLDEPAAGVPTGEAGALFEVIAALPSDISILLIEHDMELVFQFAERITVLVSGAILVEGSPQKIAADERVREVYLGAGHD